MPSLMVRYNSRHFNQLADDFYQCVKTAKHNNIAAETINFLQQLIFHSAANGCCTQLVQSITV